MNQFHIFVAIITVYTFGCMDDQSSPIQDLDTPSVSGSVTGGESPDQMNPSGEVEGVSDLEDVNAEETSEVTTSSRSSLVINEDSFASESLRRPQCWVLHTWPFGLEIKYICKCQ